MGNQVVDHRYREGRRLAGARVGDSHDVAALENQGDGLILDSRRFLESFDDDIIEYLAVYLEISE
jgi:hypothetical protein